ncbi:zinc finger protein OZF-like [Chironomus tepperi]|uniref:zinc finger protein OZF-like n=1 Tax=Chironomus tepperi TaxID=113505 RepID=UPI00391FB4BB
MSTNYKTWCRLCGDLNAQIFDDENLLEVTKKFIDIPATPQILICDDCNVQLSQFLLFTIRAKEVAEMFKGLDDEDPNDLCIRRLNAYRSHFKMSTFISSEVKDYTQEPEIEETFEFIDDSDSVEVLEEPDGNVEEILIETVDDDEELEEIVEEYVDEELENDESLDDDKTFMYHMSNSNKLLKLFTFKCHLCDQPVYPNMKLLTEHCQTVHNSQPSVKCCSDECGKMLQTWRRLLIHKEKHFPSEEAMTCGVCHTVFATKAGFENHKKTHERNFICSFCAKSFSEQKTLRFHEETHRTPLDARKSFECPHCHHKFITKQACQNHISMKHEKVVTVNCPVDGCGKGFFTRKAMLEHQRTHRDKTFRCNKCNFMSKTKSQLNVHLEKHVKIEDSELGCEKCGIVFGSVKKLRIHMTSHDGEDSYNCNKCDAKFSEKQELSSHYNMHNEL